jgi:GTP cyclohydrolase I
MTIENQAVERAAERLVSAWEVGTWSQRWEALHNLERALRARQVASMDLEDLVVELIRAIGDDPSREGLKETPKRFLRALTAYGEGYEGDPAAILKTFEDGAEQVDEMVVLNNIPIYSLCEHHLAPFFGMAHVAYIPNGKIVGLSKIIRLTNLFARRLQVQERLTNQIADALVDHLHPIGVGVLIKARHMCMEARGVRTPGATTSTSALRGAIREKAEARAEFMELCK